jgi:uncharacterized glyoxalase superfamily protein PhnB
VEFLGLTPYLYYADAAMALEWLARVFGFTEVVRYLDETGRVAEAEMVAGPIRVMMSGGHPAGPDEGAGQMLIVHVDDVDAQHSRVRAEGVEAQAPQDMPYGPRTFPVTDPGGYRWLFWQQLGVDVQLEEGWRVVRAR